MYFVQCNIGGEEERIVSCYKIMCYFFADASYPAYLYILHHIKFPVPRRAPSVGYHAHVVSVKNCCYGICGTSVRVIVHNSLPEIV
jgi:hypothetical protein